MWSEVGGSGEVRTHDVHAAELGPHLDGHAEDNTLEDAGLDELLVVRDLLFTLEADSILDFLEFSEHDRVSLIALSVDVGEDLKGFFPAVLGREPTRRLGEPEETDEEDEGRDHLDSPGDTESRRGLFGVVGATAVERRAILDEVLD